MVPSSHRLTDGEGRVSELGTRKPLVIGGREESWRYRRPVNVGILGWIGRNVGVR